MAGQVSWDYRYISCSQRGHVGNDGALASSRKGKGDLPLSHPKRLRPPVSKLPIPSSTASREKSEQARAIKAHKKLPKFRRSS